MTVGLDVAGLLVLAVAALSAGLGHTIGASRSAPRDVDPDEPPQRDATDRELPEHQALIERHHDASRRFNEAMGAFEGPRLRLMRLSGHATELAAVLRQAAAAGMDHHPAPKTPLNPPQELAPSSSRVPAVAEWRRLDRTYEALTALMADRDSTPAALADALDALAHAATAVADAFGDDATTESALAVCTFCLKTGTQARHIIAGREALICDECIRLCVEILDNDFGDGWRDDSE